MSTTTDAHADSLTFLASKPPMALTCVLCLLGLIFPGMFPTGFLLAHFRQKMEYREISYALVVLRGTILGQEKEEKIEELRKWRKQIQRAAS